MGVYVKKIGALYRLMDDRTDTLAVNQNGRSVDGGGHTNGNKAQRQAAHINHGLSEKGKL